MNPKSVLAPLAVTAVAACASMHHSGGPSPSVRPSNGVASTNGAPHGPTTPGRADSTSGAKGDSAQGSGGPGGPTAPKPYHKVITPDAVTQRGLFLTHRIGDKLYFEIPRTELGTDQLLVGRYARAAADARDEYPGDQFTERTLRWERVGNRVLLRTPSYNTVVGDTTLPIAQAVRASSYAPIIQIFDVAAYGPDSAAVIDVTRLYTTNISEFSGVKGGVDEKRSFIERVTTFPENIEIEATQTGQAGGGPMMPGMPMMGGGGNTTKSVVAHWSLIHLPHNPMTPRLSDERVGYFGIEQTDFGTTELRAAKRSYIARWRLEKKDPSAALSEPVHPIVYYIDPATPDQWKPWIRKAVLDWQPAFEAAGFKNAIIPMDPPTNDPNWSPEDVRHTVIRWLPSTTENAQGPHISDPRTGEILNGSIRMFHNILNLQRDWYFTQVAPLDVRAQHWPMPDSLMGRLLEFVVAHEIGHTLGLRHDQLGSSTYPADSVRSATWTHRMGHSPSIMDYSRFNYVAQPEDHIALEDLVPRIGPYDHFAIRWGYTPIPGAHSAEAERLTLDQWAMVQDTVPWLRFSEGNPGGYGTMPEAVGDGNPAWATKWGIKNLERVMGMLPRVTLAPGYDNDDLQELYDRTVGQWQTELQHVITTIGGSSVQYKSGSQTGAVYTPLPRTMQRASVQFLNTYAFTEPKFLLDANVIRRLEPSGAFERISGAQVSMLNSILSPDRLMRLEENRMLASGNDRDALYSMHELLTDMHNGIWRELSASRVQIDPYRRALQAAYVSHLAESLVEPSAGGAPGPVRMFRGRGGDSPDVEAAFRGDLIQLRDQIAGAIPRAADLVTRQHLQALHVKVGRILNPKGS